MLPVNYVIHAQWKTTVTVHIKSDRSRWFYYFRRASATCAHKQVCGKSLIFFFHLPGTHLNTFSVQLLGPTLTHFFSLRKEKKVSISSGKGKNLRQTTGTLPLSRDQVFCVKNEWRLKWEKFKNFRPIAEIYAHVYMVLIITISLRAPLKA